MAVQVDEKGEERKREMEMATGIYVLQMYPHEWWDEMMATVVL